MKLTIPVLTVIYSIIDWVKLKHYFYVIDRKSYLRNKQHYKLIKIILDEIIGSATDQLHNLRHAKRLLKQKYDNAQKILDTNPNKLDEENLLRIKTECFKTTVDALSQIDKTIFDISELISYLSKLTPKSILIISMIENDCFLMPKHITKRFACINLACAILKKTQSLIAEEYESVRLEDAASEPEPKQKIEEGLNPWIKAMRLFNKN